MVLFTAGTPDNYNTMTAAWGGTGFLWRRPVVFCYVRPTRHTFIYAEQNDLFTMCFFEAAYKDALNYCGTHSGRDTDKAKDTGLLPAATPLGSVMFEQARLVLECRKIYFDDIKPELMLDKSIDKLYNNDYHRMYIGEVVNCLVKKA